MFSPEHLMINGWLVGFISFYVQFPPYQNINILCLLDSENMKFNFRGHFSPESLSKLLTPFTISQRYFESVHIFSFSQASKLFMFRRHFYWAIYTNSNLTTSEDLITDLDNGHVLRLFFNMNVSILSFDNFHPIYL